MQLHGFLVHKKWHGHTPIALARYTPVGAVFYHGREARLAPWWEELRRIHRLVSSVAQAGFALRVLFHANEPLRRGAEDDGRLVAPTVRIAVLQFFQMQQMTDCLQRRE